jgi:hypothetical protein
MSYYKSENKISNADWLRSVKSQMGVVNGSRIDESDESDESDDFRDPTQSPRSVSGTISSYKDVAKEGGTAAAIGLGGVIEALKLLAPDKLHTIVMKIKSLVSNEHPDIAKTLMSSERKYSQGMR